MCHFRIAVGRKYKDRNSSEWKEEVAFVPCSVWRETAERCGQRLKKGSPVFVEGRLQSRSWDAPDGTERSTIEVVAQNVQFLPRGGGSKQESVPEIPESEAIFDEQPASQSGAPAGKGSSKSQDRELQPDDEIPF